MERRILQDCVPLEDDFFLLENPSVLRHGWKEGTVCLQRVTPCSLPRSLQGPNCSPTPERNLPPTKATKAESHIPRPPQHAAGTLHHCQVGALRVHLPEIVAIRCHSLFCGPPFDLFQLPLGGLDWWFWVDFQLSSRKGLKSPIQTRLLAWAKQKDRSVKTNRLDNQIYPFNPRLIHQPGGIVECAFL